MKTLLESITTPDASSVLPFSVLLRAVRERLPKLRRDELLVHLAQGGYALLCSGEGTYVSGIRLA